MYGIRVNPPLGEPYFLQSLSEYTAPGSKGYMSFPTADEAEVFAQNMELSFPYDVVKL